MRSRRHLRPVNAFTIVVLLAVVPSLQQAQSTRYTSVGPTQTPIVVSVLAPSGSVAAVLEESGLITVWHVELQKKITSFPSGLSRPIATDHAVPAMSVLHRDDYPVEQSLLAVGGSDGRLRVWLAGTGQLLLDAPHSVRDVMRGRASDAPIVDIDWIPGSSLTACVSSDGVFAEWTGWSPGKATRVERSTPNPGGAILGISVERERGSTLFATAGGLYFERSRSWKWALVDTSGIESDVELDARLKAAGPSAVVRRRSGAYPTQVLFAPGREHFASIWSNGEIRVYSTATLGRTRTMRMPDKSQPTLIAFNSDGSKLAVGGTGQQVYVWSVTAGAAARGFTMPRGPVRSLWFTRHDGSLVVGLSGDRSLRRIALPDTSQRFARAVEVPGTTTRLTTPSPAYEPSLSGRATSASYAVAEPIDSTSNRVLGPARAGIASVAFSTSGRLAAVLDDSGEVTIWDTRTRKRVSAFMSGQRLPMNFIGGAPLAISDSADLGPGGALVATGDNAGYLRIRNGDNSSLRTAAHGTNDRVGGWHLDTAVIDVAITRRRMIVTASERRLALWTLRAYRQPGELTLGWLEESRGEHIRDIDVSPDDSTIAVATAGGLYFVDRVTRAWHLVDTSGAESAAEYNARLKDGRGSTARRAGASPGRVRFSFDGKLLAAAYATEIRVYSIATRVHLHTFRFGEPAPGDVRRIAFSFDNKRLAATDGNQVVMIWSLDGDATPIALTTPGFIRTMSFAPNGRSIIVSGWRDRYLRALVIPVGRYD